jgi:hypothetical protein
VIVNDCGGGPHGEASGETPVEGVVAEIEAAQRRFAAVPALGMGLAAETHSRYTPEYGDVVARNRAAKGAQA